ncbi:MAG: DEAD/DEAH box helicase [Chloroflexi bacterium]|nr:DEAD/DEAH box helicase [Chloroflexota bacterium]NOG66363.1 DEAD/DEAH box helicase [Chloroflexota bacterium]GIK41818.1 MAG: RNA helicase [Chloroflexota bacterium]
MYFKDFELEPRLQRNLQTMGFERPMPIQSAAIPPALEGYDILGSAETGTGKTAAFLLPLLQTLITLPRSRDPRALVLVPTRELALQVADQARQLSHGLPLRLGTIYGGVGIGPQEQALRQGVDIVIATPGRLLDHITRRNLTFSALKVLVLDEADRMLDNGFWPDIRRIVRLLPRERQTLLFSATLQPVMNLAGEVTRQPVRVEVEKTVAPEAITQVLYPVPEHLKFKLLEHLLEDESLESVLIFARTKHRADRVVRHLQRARISAGVIHGNRSQNQRVAALESFRHGHTRVLVATDIAARGIDVDGISHVVNYDVPMQPEDYVHRIGRTGRAQAVGQAYTLVTPLDAPIIQRIEKVLKQQLKRRKVTGLDYNAPPAPLTSAPRRNLYSR